MDPLTDCPICFETYEPDAAGGVGIILGPKNPVTLTRQWFLKTKNPVSGCPGWERVNKKLVQNLGFSNLLLLRNVETDGSWGARSSWRRSTPWTCWTALGSKVGLLSAIAMLPLSTLHLGSQLLCFWRFDPSFYWILWIGVMKQRKWFHDTVGSVMCVFGESRVAGANDWSLNLAWNLL